MRIVKSLVNILKAEDITYEYKYRLTETLFKKSAMYGIEIERVDYIKEEIVNIERESIDKVSKDITKVEKLHSLVFDNLVSPIHLIDVIGEYVDKYVEEMKEERAIAYN
ncbi:DUF6514 family protein [uncultured Clostridium sp.]|uniref:DUF6514 family protein n=1 Tax=uncultured Clostridium sp. TaxID=59620 RepID=UPI00261C3381|nr:DUF6514 family protein [uncultured Clostridium sp.]